MWSTLQFPVFLEALVRFNVGCAPRKRLLHTALASHACSHNPCSIYLHIKSRVVEIHHALKEVVFFDISQAHGPIETSTHSALILGLCSTRSISLRPPPPTQSRRPSELEFLEGRRRGWCAPNSTVPTIYAGRCRVGGDRWPYTKVRKFVIECPQSVLQYLQK